MTSAARPPLHWRGRHPLHSKGIGPDAGGAAPHPRETVHAVVTASGDWYVAECLEIAVVTQARSFDALLANLREAVALYMDGEDPARLDLTPAPRLSVSFETAPIGI